jgi:hypothetical protein
VKSTTYANYSIHVETKQEYVVLQEDAGQFVQVLACSHCLLLHYETAILHHVHGTARYDVCCSFGFVSILVVVKRMLK